MRKTAPEIRIAENIYLRIFIMRNLKNNLYIRSQTIFFDNKNNRSHMIEIIIL